jgi:hypothetical protein
VSIPDEGQRLFWFPFTEVQNVCLIHNNRFGPRLQEPSTIPITSTTSFITFLMPQNGPMPVVHSLPGMRRRRGDRKQHPLPPPADASYILCRWPGCDVQLAYDQKTVSRHISRAHKGTFSEVVCLWKKPDGNICRKSVQRDQLRRHTLDLHTSLITVWCEKCGGAQRKDVMSRHRKTCPGAAKRNAIQE